MAKKAKTRQVLLLEDIPSLGNAGDLISVSPGYARNFLLPREKAAAPSTESVRFLEEKRRRRAAEHRRKEEQLHSLADAIPGTNVTIEMKVSADGRLYGAVTAQLIAETMQQAGLDVVPQQIRLEHPIKEVGQFDVPVHVYGDVTVNARIWVVSAPE